MIAQNVFFDCGYQLDGKLFCFFTSTCKVYADIINGLQYRIAKMQTKRYMQSMGMQFIFESNMTTTTGFQGGSIDLIIFLIIT